MKYSTFIFIGLLSSLCHSKSLIFIDNSVSNDTYIPSNKEKQIKIAFELAKKEVIKKCRFNDKKYIGRAMPLTIFNQEKEISKIEDQKIIVGLIHSSEAILAAEAFKKTNTLGLSSGAASDKLHTSNLNFFSLANPISNISLHVKSYIQRKKIKNAIAIIPGNSSYSIELASSLKKEMNATNQEFEIQLIDTGAKLQKTIAVKLASGNYDFIYVPGFLQQTLPIFESIANVGYKGIVYGSANLARSKSDLQLFVNSLNLKTMTIYFPATWMSGETKNSENLERIFSSYSKEEIMGTAIYTYDATLIAGSYLCYAKNELTRQGFVTFIKEYVIKNKIPTIRKYTDIKDGHFISSIATVRFDALKNEMVPE